MSNRKQIQEGLIDKFFGVFEKGLEKQRKAASAKALKQPHIQRKFKDLKRKNDELAKELEKLEKENPDW